MINVAEIKENSMAKSVLMILLSISLAVSGQFLMKNGMNQVGRIGSGDLVYYKSMLLKTFFHPYILAGLALYVVSTVSWLIVLSRVNLSFAYPFAGLGYVLTILISWRFLQEPVGAARLIGGALICLGVVFISRS
jgi:multidrug transporter EmrE-like cation transporter